MRVAAAGALPPQRDAMPNIALQLTSGVFVVARLRARLLLEWPLAAERGRSPDRRAMREGGRAWLMFKSLAVAAAAACLVVLVSTGPWARAPSIPGEVASTAQALNSGELK